MDKDRDLYGATDFMARTIAAPARLAKPLAGGFGETFAPALSGLVRRALHA